MDTDAHGWVPDLTETVIGSAGVALLINFQKPKVE